MALALGACTGDGDGDRRARSSPSPQTSEAGPSGSAGSFDFGVIGEPATLDPYSPAASDLTYSLVRPLYRSLYKLLPDGTAEPDLVEDLESTPTGVLVTLVRARWSDGETLTAADLVRSVDRARPPSGLAGLEARRVGARRVELSGEEDEWPQRLATGSYVLPQGRAIPGTYSGPLRLVERVPGLQLVYRPNPAWEGTVGLRRLRVRHVEDLSTLLFLLEEGKLDAAEVPSSVNLSSRLKARGIRFQRALGWGSVWLDLSSLDEGTRRAVAAGIDRAALEEGFVRGDGRVTDSLRPGPGPEGAEGAFRRPSGPSPAASGFSLAVPQGDELLALTQRAIQLQLAERGLRAELVTIDVRRFYGPWRQRAPVDAFLLRSDGAPGLPSPTASVRSYGAVPLFHVAEYLAGNDVRALRVNPTLEGPLWNVSEWTLEKGG